MPARKKASKKDSAANLGFEAKIWLAADSRVEDEPERSGDSQPQAARRANAVRQTAAGNRRNNIDASEPGEAKQPARQGGPKGQRGGAEQYKHVALGLIFLEYISDTFEEHRAKLLAGKGNIRRALIEADLMDCMVALPGNLFDRTPTQVARPKFSLN